MKAKGERQEGDTAFFLHNLGYNFFIMRNIEVSRIYV